MSINAASKSTSALGDASVIDFAQQTVEQLSAHQFQHDADDDDDRSHTSPTNVAVFQRHSPPLTFQISDVAIQQPVSDFWVSTRWREAMGSLPGNKSFPHCLIHGPAERLLQDRPQGHCAANHAPRGVICGGGARGAIPPLRNKKIHGMTE